MRANGLLSLKLVKRFARLLGQKLWQREKWNRSGPGQRSGIVRRPTKALLKVGILNGIQLFCQQSVLQSFEGFNRANLDASSDALAAVPRPSQPTLSSHIK